MVIYDAIVIGGGPAGLSAAIYISRFNRKCLVMDKKSGRSSFAQVTENYLGFPKGIPAAKLKEMGKSQAKRYGSDFIIDSVTQIFNHPDAFEVRGERTRFFGKTIVLATGVLDHFPKFEHYKESIGRSLFWCVACDGYKVRNKRVIVIGNNDQTATLACQLKNFTDRVTMITDAESGATKISQEKLLALAKMEITFIESKIRRVEGKAGMVKEIILHLGQAVKVDYIFSHKEPTPNVELAKQLKVELDEMGYIKVDKDMRTSVVGVYAAGDVTKPHSHQVAAAVYEGSAAGSAINADLYLPEQQA